MTGENDNSTHARYQQVLTWRAEGVPYAEIGRRLGVSGQRAHVLERQAQQWQHQEPLDTVPISVQAKRALWRAGVRTAGDIAAVSDDALLRLSGIGPGTVTTVRAYLAAQEHPTQAPPQQEEHE